jgi:hypothetical protein
MQRKTGKMMIGRFHALHHADGVLQRRPCVIFFFFLVCYNPLDGWHGSAGACSCGSAREDGLGRPCCFRLVEERRWRRLPVSGLCHSCAGKDGLSSSDGHGHGC